jgi:hypothetical protein
LSNINIEKIASSATSEYQTAQELVILPTARRHTIKINNVYAQRNQYNLKTTVKSRELITTAVKSIALFCNEYVPDNFPEGTYITYTFTINGTNYNIIPINSNKDGKKIIRTSDYGSHASYVIYLNEDIKSAVLSITMTSPDKYQTPYVSNIKILVGGE